jgi:phosphomannomutase
VFPIGWDKSFCLKLIEGQFDEVHFFGDKCFEGGNDYEIYVDSRCIGHAVTGPDNTIQILNELF